MKPLQMLSRTIMMMALLTAAVHLTGQVRIWEGTITLPTYEPKPADRNPMFYVPDAYQGAKRVIYPYPLMDNLSTEKTEKEHRAIFLENEYIKLCLLPDIGGRLLYATDKTNNYEFFYRQHVIKPANIGMLGAWISGGIEWCVFHHHRASTFLPVDTRLVDHEDGSKTVWFGEIEPRHRMKWSIGLTLYPGRSYIEADVRMFNRTGDTHSILYWANVATHVNDQYQVIFPPTVHQGTYHAKNSYIHWPVSDEIYNGRDYTGNIDVSWWKNHPEPISIFAHDLKEDFMGGYDHGKRAGTVHVGNHHIVKGAKLWEWGPGDFGHMWDCEILTDNDGPYAEIMVGGFSDNQPDYSWIKPGEVKCLKQYWYPVHDMGGFRNANLDAAVNLEFTENNRVMIGLNTTRRYENCTVILLENNRPVFEQQVTIGPAHPFSTEVQLDQKTESTACRVLLLDGHGDELISYQERERPYVAELPEPVRTPPEPGEIDQIEELVLAGQRIMQFHNPRLNPEDYFNEALRRDPLHSLANLHLGNLSARAGKYEEAAGHYRRAIERITADYTRPRDCEVLYRLGVILKKQGKFEDAVDTLYRATWDQAFYAAAHSELGGIAMIRGDFAGAIDHLDRSLSMNALNPKTHTLRSAAFRHLGDPESAAASAQRARSLDPLDHMAAFELRLLGKLPLPEFAELMNGNRENYLELSTDYSNAGLFREALEVVEMALDSENKAIASYPILHYHAGYLNEQLGNGEAAGHYYASASSGSTDYVFPFRFETLKALDAALQRNPGDAKALYYKGNILFDHQPDRAMACWEQAVSLDPDLAIAFRNLGWGAYRHLEDIGKAIEYYESALAISKDEPRYFYELDVLYELNNEPLKKRYDLFSENHEVARQRDDSYIREIEVLLLNGDYERAIAYLSGHTFLRREGAVQLHDLFVDAHLLQGRELLRSGRPEEALGHFLLADTYPDNQKIGRITDYMKEAQIYYFTGLAYLENKERKKAETYFHKAADVPVGDSEYLFYRALSQRALGLEDEAENSARILLAAGQNALNRAGETDFFAKFGERMSVNQRRASAFYRMALGYQSSGQPEQACEAFSQALEMRNSLLWANVYMEQMNNLE